MNGLEYLVIKQGIVNPALGRGRSFRRGAGIILIAFGVFAWAARDRGTDASYEAAVAEIMAANAAIYETGHAPNPWFGDTASGAAK